jgi:phage terminase large subunit-like protein
MGKRLLEMKEEFDKIRQWCTNNNLFYLKADIQIPEGVYEEALAIYNAGLFTPHRISHGKGWASATLHGEDWNVTHYNEDAKDKYQWTKLTEYAPIMTDWLKNTFPNSGKYGRCRFMLLEPGGFIRKHTDTHKWQEGMTLKNDVMSAINIAINQPENCYLRRCEDKLEVPFEDRSVFWFNNGPFHEVANFSKQNRFHFIIHGGMNEDRAKLFIDSFYKEYPDAVI